MVWLFGLIFFLVLNAYFGISDVKKHNSTKPAAFTWFVVGWMAHSVAIELPKLLM
jgi:hypothetical protein